MIWWVWGPPPACEGSLIYLLTGWHGNLVLCFLVLRYPVPPGHFFPLCLHLIPELRIWLRDRRNQESGLKITLCLPDLFLEIHLTHRSNGRRRRVSVGDTQQQVDLLQGTHFSTWISLDFLFFIFFEKGLMYSGLTITCCVTEDDFEALILLPPTPKCWDYKCAVYGFMQGWGSNLGFCIF